MSKKSRRPRSHDDAPSSWFAMVVQGATSSTSATAGDSRGSAQVLRDLEGVADGTPDDLGVYPVGESALDRAPAELVEHEVLGHALRVDVAELRVHPIPEFRQPHVAQGTAAADQNVWLVARIRTSPGVARRPARTRISGRALTRCVVIE